MTQPLRDDAGDRRSARRPSARGAFPDPVRDVLLGLLLAVTCALPIVAALYALLAARGALSDPAVPGTVGLALYALMHGGGASVEVPQTQALLGLGGSLRLGLPVTSFALLPFVASLLAGRLLGGRARAAGLFVLASAVAYALLVAVLAALGSASFETGGAPVRFAPDPFSTALRGFLWVGLGAMLGAAAAGRPLLPARYRQTVRGALWAVGISLAAALVLAVVLSFLQAGSGGQAPQGADVPSPSASPELPVQGILGALGALFALLPVALGTLWILAHGVPVGFQNAPDLGGLPLVGEALAGVPLRVGLLGTWPPGDAWRILLVAPIVGLLVGGVVGARGAEPGQRPGRGALVAVPYAAIALSTAAFTGASADLTVAGAASLEVTLRASLAWTLLVLPAGAVLGALGGLLARSDAFPLARPRRAFLVALATASAVLAASLPAAFAASSPVESPLASLAPPGDVSLPPESPFEAPPPEAPTREEESVSPDYSASTPAAPVSSDASSAAPSDASHDPVFDELLPTLTARTTAPIMLPAELPPGLSNAAVDADRSGDEYGILFQGQPGGSVLDSYVGANDVGTLTAAPTPGAPSPMDVQPLSEETVDLPDGTAATLKYLDPSAAGYNEGPYWEGTFERSGYYYTLRVSLPDVSGDTARQVLASMVEAQGGTTSGDPEEAEIVEAAEGYYEAVDREDWAYTYAGLDLGTRALFPEDEWYLKNQWFADSEGLDLASVDVVVNGSPADPMVGVTVYRTFADGTSITRNTYFVFEDGGWKHRFSQEEIDIFMPGTPYEQFVAAQ